MATRRLATFDETLARTLQELVREAVKTGGSGGAPGTTPSYAHNFGIDASIPMPSEFQSAFRKIGSYLRKFATGQRVNLSVHWK
jgi:hypothetical protein